jgi:predicted DsbA family dithiol-disulfide isomerase
LATALYSQYFENEKHPSSTETLSTATSTAGIPESEAKTVIEDEYEGLQDIKMLIWEQAGNGVGSVPYIVVEGKRRDITSQGAKEFGEYVNALDQVIKES